jgi:hypothetical protein
MVFVRFILYKTMFAKIEKDKFMTLKTQAFVNSRKDHKIFPSLRSEYCFSTKL